MRRLAVALVLFAVLSCGSAASAFEVGVRGAYWFPTFSGEFRLDSNGTQGTLVDVQDDLGVDDENFFFGEAWLWVGDHHLTLSGMKIDYSGDETLSDPIVFGGTTFPPGVRAESSLEYLMLDLSYQYDLVDLENFLAGFSLGPILQVKYMDGEVKMKGREPVTGFQVEESENFRFPIPMLGVGAHVGILADWVEARGKAAGMTYQGNSLIEAMGEIGVTPFPFLEIVGGYRYFSIDVDEQDVVLDFKQHGPYVGLSLKI